MGGGSYIQDLQYHEFCLEKGRVIIITYYHVLVLRTFPFYELPFWDWTILTPLLCLVGVKVTDTNRRNLWRLFGTFLCWEPGLLGYDAEGNCQFLVSFLQNLMLCVCDAGLSFSYYYFFDLCFWLFKDNLE